MSIPRITDYEIMEKLGVGSFATVYKVRHKKNRLFFAIKIVEKSSLSKTSTDNLITEIKLLRSLSHKYIVGLIDFFWDEKHIYIVLEYCNTGNLSTFIHLRKSLPEATCKYFLRQLATAVQYMRSNDISHFDLKPQNLLLTKNSNVTLKVADFGFAQHLKLGELNSSLKGSPLYMAPEIISKHQHDARADLWSIGVILYECLFGKAPYSSKSIEELMQRIQKHERITIPCNTKISAECEDLLTRLLQHEPSDRITFEDFFKHPFLDLKTIPSDKSLEKAVSIVTKAVECDEQKNYKEAYYLYCSALQYFVPLITEEPDASKRQVLRNKSLLYLKRAEEIKSGALSNNFKQNPSSSSSTNQQCSVSGIVEPDTCYKQLYALSNPSPSLKNALEIGRQGELYSYEKKYDTALESFTSALSILVPFLNNEPKGDRKTLLLKQIDYWMKEAESIKMLLSVKEISDENKISTVYSCTIQ